MEQPICAHCDLPMDLRHRADGAGRARSVPVQRRRVRCLRGTVHGASHGAAPGGLSRRGAEPFPGDAGRRAHPSVRWSRMTSKSNGKRKPVTVQAMPCHTSSVPDQRRIRMS